MYDCLFVLPNQLFKFPENNVKYNTIIVIEHPLYFKRYKYHINKLILHRASMKLYAKKMEAQYINCTNYHKGMNTALKKYTNFAIFDPIDHDILEEFDAYKKLYNKDIAMLDNPNFICSLEDLVDYNKELGKKRATHSAFYTHFRKKYDILINNKSQPIGDKWSFDTANRLKFPAKYVEVLFETKYSNEDKKFIEEAITYATSLISTQAKRYLSYADTFYLPISEDGAMNQFLNFVNNKLNNFGPYEDAMRSDVNFGYHSVLSPILNIGLLDPEIMVNVVSRAYREHGLKIESVEGYVRQLFWREYCRYIYVFKIEELTNNIHYFPLNKQKLNPEWFDCSIETKMPNVDNCIAKFAKYGYLHHIERLMCVGNFMLLTEINPNQVFEWFMMFVDAYPWAMYPNVYGMSQFSAGPIMMKRPYFSASNYIKKMSSYKGVELAITPKISVDTFDIWDALYYRFIDNNKSKLSKIYATASAVKTWKNKSAAERSHLLYLANLYLKKYV